MIQITKAVLLCVGVAFLAIAVLAATGCGGPEPTQQMMDKAQPRLPDIEPQSTTRFEVSRVGVFRDNLAYDNVRGIYVIVDKQTGTEYVGVSGIGISELGSHSTGKSQHPDER